MCLNILLQVWQRWEIAGTVGTTTGQPNEREDAILYVSTVLLYIQAVGGWSRHVPPKIKLHNHIGVRPFSLLRVRMVISATPKTSCHTRLISLPYKTLYLIVTAEEQWYWLKASEATSSSSPSVIIPWLGDLRNLYECIDNLFLLLFTHEFCPMNFGKNGMKNCWMDPSGCWMYVAPLEIFSQMKECVKELESSLPRRRGGESGLANEVRAYMNGRKKSKKFFCKCLKNLKRGEELHTIALRRRPWLYGRCCHSKRSWKNQTCNVWIPLVIPLSQTKARPKQSGWFLVSKSLQSNRGSCQGEVEKIDIELLVLKSK